jgi:serine/threonine protein kinase/tetratricopeptide (TPR) repeat protein
MEQERWRQIEQLYHSAKERDPGQRRAYLTDACRGDEDLRREIESLLAQDTSREGVLDRPAADLLGDSTVSQFAGATDRGSDHLEFAPGTVLGGRFRIIRAAGDGGMGIVYEALDEKLNQRVALKGAKPGYGDRLPPEARAAREVSHFNVCKVHDLHVASTPLGEMEFLSMEFIDGQTLSEQIDRDGPVPEPEAREIARQICAGLAQAHSQGVIHGDLKPANIIIVRAPRTAIRVVITDFGIATVKVIDGAPAMGGRGGTPDFMAPELFLGERSTIASDIYALGILFHVMLTGHSPKRIAAPVMSSMPPSIKADSQADTITAGSVVVADWQRSIEDLPPPWSGLVARCIAPRPEDRYSSAEAVSHSLRPRRIVMKVGALAAAVATLAFGYWQWSAEPVGPPVRLAVLPFSVQGDPVPSAGGIGLDVANRLSGARRNFTVISPREAQRNGVETPVNAKNMLGATHVLETRLRRSGATIEATATLTDLGTGRTLGQPLNGTYAAGDAATLAKAILATVTGAFQLRSRVPKESVARVAYPYYVQGMELLQQSDSNSDKAIPYFEKAIELDPQSALPYAGLAAAQILKFDMRDGPKWLETAAANVARAEAINADSVPVLLVSGAFQQSNGAYESALHAFTRATVLDPNNPEAWKRLADAYDKAHRTDEAIATYRRAMKAQPNYYGNYLGLGNLYWYRSEFREAEDLYRRVTTIAPDLATGHADLGLALMEQGRYQEAEGSLLRALRLHRSSQTLMNIGGLYYAEERYSDAVNCFEESIASGTPSAMRLTDLGDGYRHLGRSREAKEAYRSARDMAQDEVTRNPRRAESRMLLALVSALLGDSHTALFEGRQALSFEPENAIVMRDAILMYEVLHQREESFQVLRRIPRRLLGELTRQPDLKDLQQDPRFQELIRAQAAR